MNVSTGLKSCTTTQPVAAVFFRYLYSTAPRRLVATVLHVTGTPASSGYPALAVNELILVVPGGTGAGSCTWFESSLERPLVEYACTAK